MCCLIEHSIKQTVSDHDHSDNRAHFTTLRFLFRYMGLWGAIERCTMEELVSAVKRGSQGFSHGISSYRGVSRHFSGEYLHIRPCTQKEEKLAM